MPDMSTEGASPMHKLAHFATEYDPPTSPPPSTESEGALPLKKRLNGAKTSDFNQGGRKKPPPKMQLPMFLSKTFHMINRCDPEVATWSASGDSFVIKQIEAFSVMVLPQYFKHSNFSSFARQLNFYGFRKLKAEPICLLDADEKTATHVSFFHRSFQKDRPELLQHIKRATKGAVDQQSKDEVESVRNELAQLRSQIEAMRTEHDKKIAEIAIEYNRRLATLSTQYGSLLALVQQVIPKITGVSGPNTSSSVAGAIATDDLMQSLSHVAGMHLQHSSSVQSNKTIFTGVGVLSAATGDKRNSSNLVSQNSIADDQNSKRGRVEKGNTPPVSACSKGVSDSV